LGGKPPHIVLDIGFTHIPQDDVFEFDLHNTHTFLHLM